MQLLLKYKNILYFLSIILLGFLIRVYLSFLGFHVDIFSQAHWGEWIFQNGPKGFYTYEIWIYSWPNHPPLSSLIFGFDRWLYQQILDFFRWLTFYIVPHLAPGHMVWWFDFVRWFDIQRYDVTIFKTGYLAAIKLLPIVADIFISILLFIVAKKQSISKAVIFPLVYLFSPFSFYLSSLWGQTDNLSFLIVLLAFIFLINKKITISIILFVVSMHIKPTTFLFIPLFLWFLIKIKPRLISLILGLVGSLIITFAIIAPFTDSSDIIGFTKTYLFPKVFHRAEFRLTTNSFNFWHIWTGNKAFSQDITFLFISAKNIGWIIFILLNLFAFRIINQLTMENLFKGMFLVSLGGWLFLTNMLERYLFAGIVSLLFLSIYQPRFLKYWLVLSSIFWLNLYHGWWFPYWLELFRQILVWQEGFITRLLSLLNVILFFRLLPKVAER